jgi:hypothetical protein
MLGVGATAVGDAVGTGGAVGIGDAAVAVADTDGAIDDLAGAGGCVEFSDTVSTLTTSTINATIPIPPPKMTRLRSDHPV